MSINWNITTNEAISIQKNLRTKVITDSNPSKVSLVAGVDLGIEGDMVSGAVVVVKYPSLEPVEEKTAMKKAIFPYVPGLLAFREIPAILEAITKLTSIPDVFLVDGQGIAHPRRFGIASHLGVLLDKPTIGSAKSRLFGTHKKPNPTKGSFEYLLDNDDIIGAVLVTRDNTNPIYVSIGHKVTLKWALDLVLKCAPKYRIPEPIRLADKLASGASIMNQQQSLF